MIIVVLLGGVLFSMMVGVSFGLTEITTLASPSSQAKADGFLALENMRASLDQTFFQRDIKRLVFLGKRGGGGETRSDILTFACVHPNADAMGVPAVREVSYYLEPDPDVDPGEGKSYILIRREDEMIDEQPGQGGNHYPLVGGVVARKFRYSLNGKDWKDEWDSSKIRRIPRMIQIQMRDRAGNRIMRFETMSRPGLYIR